MNVLLHQAVQRLEPGLVKGADVPPPFIGMLSCPPGGL
jgi:hypothetical protein